MDSNQSESVPVNGGTSTEQKLTSLNGDHDITLEVSDNVTQTVAAPKVPFPSCRTVLTLMAFFGFINIYCLRVNLSVALVAMVNSTYILELSKAAAALSAGTSQNDSYSAEVVDDVVCETGNASHHEETDTGSFNWTMQQQGIVLAAFFYGYITTQVIGGTLAQRVGGKLLLLFGICWTAVLTLLTPVLTVAGDFAAIVAVRTLEGIGEGVTYPSMHAMLSKWAPPMERSKMATMVYAGAQIGTVMAMPISGLLCKFLGWESVFYVFGALGVVWSVMWFFLAYNSPAVHPRITEAERQYIETALGKSKQKASGSMRVPWLSVATSLPVYALAVAHFSNNWGYYTLLTCLPQYLKHILHFDIKSNGLISGLPYLVMWLFIVLSGLVADKLRTGNVLSTTNVRKLMNAVGFIGPAVCLIATGYVTCSATLAVFLIVIGVGLSGISMAGWSVNHLDLAPQYAGTLMGITNSVGTIPGFVGPSVVGALTNKNQTRAAWRNVFFITAGVYAFGTIVYCLFGTGEKQPWGEEKCEDEVLQQFGPDDENPKKKKEADETKA